MVKTYLIALCFAVAAVAQTDPTATWPTGSAGVSDIPISVDSSASALAADINAVTTSVQVVDGTRFKQYQLVRINAEKMLITAIVGNVLTVSRGYAGSVANSHSAIGASCSSAPTYPSCVRGEIFSWNQNKLRAEVIAMQASLLPSYSTTVAGTPSTCIANRSTLIKYNDSGGPTHWICDGAGTGWTQIAGGGGGVAELPYRLTMTSETSPFSLTEATHARGKYPSVICFSDETTVMEAGSCGWRLPKDESSGNLTIYWATRPYKLWVVRGERSGGTGGGDNLGSATAANVVALFSGTPSGKFLKDDGTLAVPAGGTGAGVPFCNDATGSTTAYTCPSADATSLTNLIVNFSPQANNSGCITLNIAGLGAKAVYWMNGNQVCEANAIVASNRYIVAYNGTVLMVTNGWQLINDNGTLDVLPGSGIIRVKSGVYADMVPPEYTYAAAIALCDSSNRGRKFIVTDSNTTTWGAVVAAGSTNKVETICNGTALKVTGVY